MYYNIMIVLCKKYNSMFSIKYIIYIYIDQTVIKSLYYSSLIVGTYHNAYSAITLFYSSYLALSNYRTCITLRRYRRRYSNQL